MNLTELRNKVKAITDYSPELAVYNEQLDGLINDAYYALWTKKRWRFAERRWFMDIFPDFNSTQEIGGGAPYTANALVTNNSRGVTFSANVNPFIQPQIWEGQVIQIDGVDYGIQKVTNTTSIQLDRPFRSLDGSTTVAVTTSNWKVKHRFYDLPQDAIELLYLGHRDTPVTGKQPPYGAVRGLLARRDEDINLMEDYTSFYSECYIPVPVTNVPPGERLGITVQTVGGNWPASTFMEFCWAFELCDGRLGALSEPTIATTASSTSTNQFTLAFLSFDNQTVAAPAFLPLSDQNLNQYEGLRKRIFFNQNFDRVTGIRKAGLPVWREVINGSTSIAPSVQFVGTKTDPIRILDTAGTYIIVNTSQCVPGNKRYMDYDGVNFRIRPYPRPIGSDFKYEQMPGASGAFPPPVATSTAAERLFRQWECRYYRKPHPMALPTDAPELPMEFHQLIVYKALEDIFSKHDNIAQAANYRKRYEDELKRLETRYVDSVDVDVVRQQFGGTGRIYTPFDPNSLRRLN